MTELRTIIETLLPAATALLGVAQIFIIKALQCAFAATVIFAAIWGIKKVIRRSLSSTNANHDTIYSVLSSLLKYIGYFLVAYQVLRSFGVSVESILAIAGIGSIAIGFGARGLAEDVITGASILFEDHFRVGDSIEINGKSGIVENIGLRATIIRGFDGDVYIFPNSTIKLVTNMSKSFNRAIVNVPVAVDEDIERVIEILNNEVSNMQDINGIIGVPRVEGIVEMSSGGIVIRIAADCNIGKNWEVERVLRRAVKTRFEREAIAPLCKKE